MKRKYYNANKVNAVFEEIRSLAEKLVDENERLQVQIQEKEDLEKKEQAERASLKEVQETYRELLAKAHVRAEAIVSDAEDYRTAMEKLAEQRCSYAARQLESVMSTLRRREEQNIEYLNSQMQTFLAELYDADREENPGEEEDGKLPALPSRDRRDGPEAEAEDDMPEDLVSKINRLTREIKALETE